MHPVYSHLPLLRVDPSLLHQFPPHRPPVPDPSELRAFAEMRTIPMPKSLQAPYLLSSLVDEFIPSSTSYLAFQNSTDWSYSLYLDILNVPHIPHTGASRAKRHLCSSLLLYLLLCATTGLQADGREVL